MYYSPECGLCEDSIWVWERCLFWCWMQHSINVKSRWMIIFFQVISVITDFLSVWYINYLKRGAWHTNIIMDLFISPYSSINSCLTYFNALLLGAYMLKMIISSWRIDHFIIISFPTLALISFLGLNSVLSEINIVLYINYSGFLLISASMVYLSLT